MTKTLFEKVWDTHIVAEDPGAPAVLYIDAHLVHEVTSPQAFAELHERGLPVRRPDKTFATMDHAIPTRQGITIDLWPTDAATQVRTLRQNCADFGVTLFDIEGDVQGIVHVVGPEMGITQPGMTIVCGDSHTSTHGAFRRAGLWHWHQRGRPCVGDAMFDADPAQDLRHYRGW